MSIKQSLFQTSLHTMGPANVYTFVAWIPGMVNSCLLCSSAQWPTLQRSSVSLGYHGRTIDVPVAIQNSGDITLTFYETQSFMVRWEIVKKFVKATNELSDELLKLFNMRLYSLQAGGVMPSLSPLHLEGCYVKSKGSVTLSGDKVTEPWSWTVTIHYNRIIEDFGVASVPVISDGEIIAATELMKGLHKLMGNNWSSTLSKYTGGLL